MLLLLVINHLLGHVTVGVDKWMLLLLDCEGAVLVAGGVLRVHGHEVLLLDFYGVAWLRTKGRRAAGFPALY